MNLDFLSPDILHAFVDFGWVYAVWIFMGVIGLLIGKLRGRESFGFWMGFLLGPLGWLITLLMGQGGPKCPECFGTVDPRAKKCCHCASDLPSLDPFAERGA